MIIDSVIGFNELELFKIRYEELKSDIDYFVVLEATHTHSGKPKRMYFTEEHANTPQVLVYQWDNGINFAPLTPEYAWHREHAMREMLRYILLELCIFDDDIIMVSDMDEIPSANALDNWTYNVNKGIWRFEQRLTYLYLNTFAGLWHGTRIFRRDNMPSTMKQARYDDTAGNVIPHGGWHFSSVGGLDRVKTKLQSFAHTELSEMPAESIQDSLARAVDPFHKNPLSIEGTDGLPEYVKNNLEDFAHLIYNGNH